jgi:hypothetical protein
MQSLAPLIAFLDVDDRWHSGCLLSQVRYMQDNPDTAFSFANYAHVDETGPIAVSAFEFWPLYARLPQTEGQFRVLPKALSAIFKENAVGTSTVVARRDAIIEAGMFDRDLRSASDWDLWLRLAALGPVAYNSEVRMDYLMRANSISANKADRLAAVALIHQRYGKAANRQARGSLRYARGTLELAAGDLAYQHQRYVRAAGHHLKAALSTRSTRAARALAHDVMSILAV